MKNTKFNPSRTILTISIGFIIVYLITQWQWAITTSLIVGLIGIFSNYLSTFIHKLWMKLAWLLSLIIPNIILGIVFYIFLFPLAILSRVFGDKNPLKLKNKFDSVYNNSRKDFDKACFEKLW